MKKLLSEMTDQELWALFPIVLSHYDPDWEEWYEEEEHSLLDLLDEQDVVRINHIGSTAVFGMTAKPTVDILLEIPTDTDTEKLICILEDNGYIYSKQPENPPPHMMFLKGYTEWGFADQVFHLHIRYPGDWDELYFRDYLRHHKQIAEQYGKLKKELGEKYEQDRDAYTKAKTDFIMKYTRIAREELGGKYSIK